MGSGKTLGDRIAEGMRILHTEADGPTTPEELVAYQNALEGSRPTGETGLDERIAALDTAIALATIEAAKETNSDVARLIGAGAITPDDREWIYSAGSSFAEDARSKLGAMVEQIGPKSHRRAMMILTAAMFDAARQMNASLVSGAYLPENRAAKWQQSIANTAPAMVKREPAFTVSDDTEAEEIAKRVSDGETWEQVRDDLLARRGPCVGLACGAD